MSSSEQPLVLLRTPAESEFREHSEGTKDTEPFQPITQLSSCNVKFLRVAWCDTANVIRAKAAYVPRLEGVCKDGVALCIGNMALPAIRDAIADGSGLGPVGDLHLMPDWGTLRVLPYAKGHASVMADMFTKEGQPSPLCPRNFLRKMVAETLKSGLCLKAAFENEFYLLKQSSNGSVVPVDNTTFCMTYSMDVNHDVIMDICQSLTEQGLILEQYHPESGNGQHEISILYSDAMRAADQQIVFRETVKAVAHKHGLVASFLPKIYNDQAGSGTHLHLSLHSSDGTNIVPSQTSPNTLSATASHFVAGLLEHLPGLMGITAPTNNSYKRLRPHTWSGANRVWGYENKECAIRVPLNYHAPSPTHFEYKTNDATANPYLALGAILAAGLDGVNRKLPLAPPVETDPGLPKPEVGLFFEEILISRDHPNKKNADLLPESLGESLEALSKDEVLLEAMGPSLSQAYLAVKQADYRMIDSLELEVKHLLTRY